MCWSIFSIRPLQPQRFGGIYRFKSRVLAACTQLAAQNPSSPSKQKFLSCLSETRSIVCACTERILVRILPAKTDTIAKLSLLRYWQARDIKAKDMKTPGCFPRTLTGLTQGCCQVHWWHCSEVLHNCFPDLRQILMLSDECCWKCLDVFMSVRRHFLDQIWIRWPSNRTDRKTYLLSFKKPVERCLTWTDL